MSIALNVPKASSNHDIVSLIEVKEKTWGAIKLEAMEESFKTLETKVVSTTQSVINGLSDLTAKTNEVAAVFRKLQKHTWLLVEHLTSSPGFFKKFIGITERYVAFVDCIQIANDVNYFVQKGWEEKITAHGKEYKPADSKAVIAAKVSMTVTDVGAVLLWFEAMGFYTLKNAAASIGNTRIFSFAPKAISSIPVLRDISGLQKAANTLGNLRVFSFATKVSPLFVTLRALDLMYAFFAVDAAQRLVNGDTAIRKTSAGLDLSSYLAELTLSAAVIAGVANVIVLGTMAAACITLALAAFFYRSSHHDELKHSMPKTQLIKV